MVGHPCIAQVFVITCLLLVRRGVHANHANALATVKRFSKRLRILFIVDIPLFSGNQFVVTRELLTCCGNFIRPSWPAKGGAEPGGRFRNSENSDYSNDVTGAIDASFMLVLHEIFQTIWRLLSLMLRLPLFVWHAVDQLPC